MKNSLKKPNLDVTNANETEDNHDHFKFLKSTPEKTVIQRQFIETLQKDLCQAQKVLQRLSNFLKKDKKDFHFQFQILKESY